MTLGCLSLVKGKQVSVGWERGAGDTVLRI
jgi:hypothetical protein